MIEVGKTDKRTVSQMNSELYNAGVELMADEGNKHPERLWHIGWADFGDFIDWLETNYEITKRVP